MILERLNEYKIGDATVRSIDFFKAETEKDLREGFQHIIARMICNHESDETTTYYTI